MTPVTGLLFLLEVSASSPWSPGSPAASINWTIPFFSLSLSLNIILTIAITSRLLFYRQNIVSVMGTSHGSQYASIAAMIVESAAIFSTFSLLFLVPFAMNNPLNEVFFQALSGVQVSSYRISLRSTLNTILIIRVRLFRILDHRNVTHHVQSLPRKELGH